MATKTLFTTKDIMGQIGYYVRGTKVRFLHNEVERNGSIVQYLDESKTYQILGTDDISYFVKPHYIELCPLEPVNQGKQMLQPGTKVSFRQRNELKDGIILRYNSKNDNYEISSEQELYYVAANYIVCHTEANQDHSTTMSNHQSQSINAGKTTVESFTKHEDKLGLLELALNGSRGRQQQIIAEEGLALVELLLRKNNDYNSSVFKPPVLAPELPILSAIDVRMSDKISRINNLKTCATEVKSETIDETYKDLAGYVILRRSVQQYLLETDPSRSGT